MERQKTLKGKSKGKSPMGRTTDSTGPLRMNLNHPSEIKKAPLNAEQQQ